MRIPPNHAAAAAASSADGAHATPEREPASRNEDPLDTIMTQFTAMELQLGTLQQTVEALRSDVGSRDQQQEATKAQQAVVASPNGSTTGADNHELAKEEDYAVERQTSSSSVRDSTNTATSPPKLVATLRKPRPSAPCPNPGRGHFFTLSSAGDSIIFKDFAYLATGSSVLQNISCHVRDERDCTDELKASRTVLVRDIHLRYREGQDVGEHAEAMCFPLRDVILQHRADLGEVKWRLVKGSTHQRFRAGYGVTSFYLGIPVPVFTSIWNAINADVAAGQKWEPVGDDVDLSTQEVKTCFNTPYLARHQGHYWMYAKINDDHLPATVRYSDEEQIWDTAELMKAWSRAFPKTPNLEADAIATFRLKKVWPIGTFASDSVTQQEPDWELGMTLKSIVDPVGTAIGPTP